MFDKLKISQYILFLFIGILLFTSCTPLKKIRYFQAINETTTSDSTTAPFFDQYRLKPGDVIRIIIQGDDNEVLKYFITENQFAQGLVQSSNQNNDGSSIYLQGHIINDSGFIYLPKIGKLLVGGYTLKETELIVESELKSYLKNPYVSVSFLSFKYSVFGEVQNPGLFRTFDTRINIFEALSLAGDINRFGNRKEVLVVRKVNNNLTYNYLDLTQRKVVTSPYFFLQPGDMVYVKPLPNKNFNFSEFNWGVMFSLISTIVSLYILMK